MLHHRLLHRMQTAIGAAQMFHRHHMTAVAGGQEPDAGIDRLIAEPLRPEPSDQNRAGPAIALGAALLGAGQPAVEAQEVEQGLAGPHIRDADLAPVQQKPDLATMLHVTSPNHSGRTSSGL